MPALLQRDVRLLRKALKHSLAELAAGDEERHCLRRRVEDLNTSLQVCWPINLQGCSCSMVKAAEVWPPAHLCPTALVTSLSLPWRLRAHSVLVLWHLYFVCCLWLRDGHCCRAGAGCPYSLNIKLAGSCLLQNCKHQLLLPASMLLLVNGSRAVSACLFKPVLSCLASNLMTQLDPLRCDNGPACACRARSLPCMRRHSTFGRSMSKKGCIMRGRLQPSKQLPNQHLPVSAARGCSLLLPLTDVRHSRAI